MYHKSRLYIAHFRRDGTIAFASESAGGAGLRKKAFYSPSEAAKAVTGKAVNGWTVWLHERAPGDWVKLDGLRK